MRRIQRNEKSTAEHGTTSEMLRERNNRRTVAMSDMSFLGNNRRIQSPRRVSTMPPPSQLDMTRRLDVEGNNNEISFLYDKYLQTLMIEHVMMKKEVEKRKAIISQLTSLEKKGEECDIKLHEIQMRINELGPLNEAQKYLENQILEIQKFLDTNQPKVTEVLDKIYFNLRSFDKLECKNIIVPETKKELMTMHGLFNECNQLLDSISSVMGNKSAEIISTNEHLKKLQKLIFTTEKLMKKTHNKLEHVQIDILKKGAAELSINNM